MKIIFYCQSVTSFDAALEKLLKANALIDKKSVLWCDSSSKTRMDCINESPINKWMLFLDHDCFIDEPAYKELLKYIDSQKNYQSVNGLVMVGQYKNHENSSAIQKAHNWIANNWINFWFDESKKFPPVLLGGAFALIKFKENALIEEKHKIKSWGAEDKTLARELYRNNFAFFFLEGFRVTHDTSKSFIHLVRRAFLHGYNDDEHELFSDQKIAGFNYQLSYWKRKFASLDFCLILPVLVHFCVQIMGRIFRIVRRVRK